jgi:ABC-type oligopeptide transport system substrate-binding subunit
VYSSQAKLLILFLTTLVLSGCYSTKALQNQPVEIEKNEVYLDAKLVKNTPVNFIITTPVNKKFAGIPVKRIF